MILLQKKIADFELVFTHINSSIKEVCKQELNFSRKHPDKVSNVVKHIRDEDNRRSSPHGVDDGGGSCVHIYTAHQTLEPYSRSFHHS